MTFLFHDTGIEGLYIVEMKRFGDSRGYFAETYNKRDFDAAGLSYDFVQDNQSHSTRGVLRGLHFQKIHQQAKLVRVLEGEVYDVAVDLRKESKTFGKWRGIVLSGDNNLQFMIPRGFAHGFQVISDAATFCYKCDEFYHPEDEGGLKWDDEYLNIDWPLKNNAILSDKDKIHPSFKELLI